MMRQLLLSCSVLASILAPALLCQTQNDLQDKLDIAGTLKKGEQLVQAGSLREAEIVIKDTLTKGQPNRTHNAAQAKLLNLLGVVLQVEGKYSEAEARYRQAASDFEALLGAQHPLFAIALANVGSLLADLGHYPEAYSLIRRGIDIAVPVVGDCAPEVALMYSSLAHLFYLQRNADRALPVAHRALACIEKQGTETVEAGRAHVDLAAAYFVGGEYSLAKDHLDLAKAIFAKSLPADHPDSMLTKNVQICLYYKLGQFKQARELGLQAAEQIRKKFGPEHPALAVTLANVGYADQRLKLYREAIGCFRQAIAIQEAINSQDPYVAELLRGYARVLREAHRKPEAKQVESRAKAILANAVR
jgi:tetratricopeptide (TPR) repeat protein